MRVMQMIKSQEEKKMTFEIDKGKKLPDYIKSKKEELPLEDMKVDDSFFYPFDAKDEDERKSYLNNLRVRIWRTRIRKNIENFKFHVSDKEEGGARVWRIK
jgi:hypothetical protein|tara:strand:+ start:474 stop:776 length:303 start_codon:yes stop_codon:yes gene_type:complete